MKFVLVCVLYNQKIVDLPFYAKIPWLLSQNIPIICYDNSRHPQENPYMGSSFTYQHDPRNLGLSEAYNFALKKAVSYQADGLLLLDDDSNFSNSFITNLKTLNFSPKVAVVVPQVFDEEKQVSPVYAGNYINRFSKFAEVSGIYSERMMAINSGSLWNVAFLQKIGGFSSKFPLDFLDHWLFFKVYEQGFQVQVNSDRLRHHLSVLNFKTMSHQRYENILAAETRFYENYERRLLKAHKKQLLKRSLKQWLKVKDPFFWQKTFSTFQKIKKGDKVQ